MNPPPIMLRPEDSVLLVVDLQEKLLPVIEHHDVIAATSGKLIRGADILAVPVLATEQYPQGLGSTQEAIREKLGDRPCIEKTRFSACVDPVLDHLTELGRPHVVVCGIETHVCVLQTVLDLLRLGYIPCVCVDAVGSRRGQDHRVGLERMRSSGAVLTTLESLLFEWLGQAGTGAFKQVLPLVK